MLLIKNTANISSSFRITKQNKLILLSNCPICSKRNSKLIKHEEAIATLSQLGIRSPLSNITLIADILF